MGFDSDGYIDELVKVIKVDTDEIRDCVKEILSMKDNLS